MNDKRDGAKDDALIGKARELFDESVSELDAATLSRLNRSRHLALEHASSDARTVRWNQWLPAAGVAAASVFAIVLWTGTDSVDVLTPPATVSDFEIILEGDDFEMLENLEFYSWIDLDDEPDTAANVG